MVRHNGDCYGRAAEGAYEMCPLTPTSIQITLQAIFFEPSGGGGEGMEGEIWSRKKWKIIIFRHTWP